MAWLKMDKKVGLELDETNEAGVCSGFPLSMCLAYLLITGRHGYTVEKGAHPE